MNKYLSIERDNIKISNQNGELRNIKLNDMNPEYFTSFGVKLFIIKNRYCA